jgi:5'-methylthioadenosine phosphorylase
LATDYDCWHEAAESVTVEGVVAILNKNVALSRRIIRSTVPRLPGERACPCATALKNAILTSPSAIPRKIKSDLKPIIGKYLTPERKR